MNTITASQLAILLDTTKKEAVKKVIVALEREKGNDGPYIDPDKQDDYEKNPSISIDTMSRYLNIDLQTVLKSMRDNFLSHPSTGRWILDYPIEKLKPNKETGNYPRSVKIPETLRSMLSEETQNKIIEKWKEIYKDYTIKYGVQFK